MSDFGGITLLGLGPGSPDHLTLQAAAVLQSCTEIYLRTKNHPAVTGFPTELIVSSFDHLYEQAENFEDVYAQIVEQILVLGQRSQGVVYGVPGHPFIAESTSPEIFRRAREGGIPVRVVEGLSFIEPAFTALGIDPFPHTALVDALDLAAGHYPSFPPSGSVLIAQVYSREVASGVKLTLMEVYPDEHPVTLIHAAGTSQQVIESLPLYEIDRSEAIGLLTCLYVPALSPASSLEAFQEVVAHLRAPDGCPWDLKQTLGSLRPHLLEEAYEVLTALDREDPVSLMEELGDLLLVILMLVQIANEDGEFKFPQVMEGIHSKIVRRHPHVFGELVIEDEAGVLLNWEKLKAAERIDQGQSEKSLLDGVAAAFPALQQAQEMQARAARIGFDWRNAHEVWQKVREELLEIEQSTTLSETEAEFGDLLFSLVNLMRHLNIDAESALRGANGRFRKRFSFIEAGARAQGRKLDELSLPEMDELWEAAKHNLHRDPGD
jgi:tetrapyrrole methylase family protein / MazG family protein